MSWIRKFLFPGDKGLLHKASLFKKSTPNVKVKGVIARCAAVVPLYVGGNAENAYAIMLEGQKEIIMFKREIVGEFTSAHLALLQPGDYVEFEVDKNGIGQISTMRSAVWAGWVMGAGSAERAAQAVKQTAQDEKPKPPVLTMYTNPNFKRQGSSS